MSLPGRFVETTAGRVFVHRAGPKAGPPLVMVHGFAMSHFYFRDVTPRLSERHDVIALDLPGFGESDRPSPEKFNYDLPGFAGVVAEVMDALGVARSAVLGASMGGGAALTLAARSPERVERLVLVDPAIYPLALPFEGRLLLSPTLGTFLFRHAVRRADFKRVMIRDTLRDPSFATDELVDYFWARLNRAGGREAAYAALTMLAHLADANDDPSRVTAPTLILWGEEDRAVPLANGKRLHRAIPGSRLSVVPACGHMPFLERPDEFLRQLEPFLAAPAGVTAQRSRAS